MQEKEQQKDTVEVPKKKMTQAERDARLISLEQFCDIVGFGNVMKFAALKVLETKELKTISDWEKLCEENKIPLKTKSK
jgi:hypothetical protein